MKKQYPFSFEYFRWGIEVARGEFLLLLNNDAGLAPDFFARLREGIARHPAAGMYSTRILNYYDRSLIDNTGHVIYRDGTARGRSRLRSNAMATAQQAPASPFLDPGFMDDPYTALTKLRAEDPVHFVAPLGFWFILRHDDVKRLFNDPENATPDRRAWEHFSPRPPGTFMRWVEDNGFFSLPAEEHTRLRKLHVPAPGLFRGGAP